jgi:hypothetical protein
MNGARRFFHDSIIPGIVRLGGLVWGWLAVSAESAFTITPTTRRLAEAGTLWMLGAANTGTSWNMKS